MTFDPTSVEVTCVTLPKDHCVQVPWKYINVCGYSDQFCKNYHIHTYTYYIHILHTHTTYRISDHIVSFWTTFRRDKNGISALWLCSGKAGASLLGQDVVASLLSLCMAKWLRKWRRGWLYVRSNTKNAKSLMFSRLMMCKVWYYV